MVRSIQQDRVHLERVMRKEVKAIFGDKIWVKEREQMMFKYYDSLKRAENDSVTQQIMTISSFGIKRHPDERLSKYTARLCCHRRQQQ